MSKIIVIGAAGQLGQCLQAIIIEKQIQGYVFLKKEDADILKFDTLKDNFKLHKPAYCINCAAYTAVDKAEDEPELANRINRDGVANLSRLCSEFETTLIHISTDFVFSGYGNYPLTEQDTATPVSTYGTTKLMGEKAIPKQTKKYFIIRTSWLYSEYGSNFVKNMIRLSKEKEELRVVWDQTGTPTYARDLAKFIIEIVERDSVLYGTYHYSNEGATTWYDFVMAIFELNNSKTKVIPIRTSEYPLRAARPSYSVFDKSKVKRNFNIEIPYWRKSLEYCINRLGEKV